MTAISRTAVQQEFPNPFRSAIPHCFLGPRITTRPVGSTIRPLSQEIIDKATTIYRENLTSLQPHAKSLRLGMQTIPKNFEVIPGLSLPFTIYIHGGRLFLIQELIGEGSFAKAKILTSIETGEVFVLRRSIDSDDFCTPLHTPGCASTYYMSRYNKNKKQVSIMRYYNQGDLNSCLAQNPPILEKITLCLHMSLGLQRLHREDIVHGDLKPNNVFWNRDYLGKVTAVLGDFDLFQPDGAETYLGTELYLSPQVLENFAKKIPLKAEKSNDIWSLGIIFITVLAEDSLIKLILLKIKCLALKICENKQTEKFPVLFKEFNDLRENLIYLLNLSSDRMLKEVCAPMLSEKTKSLSISEVVSRTGSIYKQLLASQQKRKRAFPE
jgi:serine/threonine protein kinase